MAHVVVIGGGIAGLAAAHALRGFDVTVLEGSDRLGGKLRTSPVAGIDVDEGAESFLARVPEALGLARAVGCGDALVNPATSAASVWSRGRLRPLPPRTLFGVPASVGSLYGVLSLSETLRASADLMRGGDASDQDESVGALVGRRMGRAVVDRLVDPLLGGVYAGRADELSTRATVPQLATATTSLIRAVRVAVPAPTGSPAPVFATLLGGLGSFADAVAHASGARLVTGRLVRRLHRTASGFRVVHGATTDEQAIDADAVVVAVPATNAARLLADVAPAATAELNAIEAASVAVVTTVWRRQDVTRVNGSGYLVPSVAGRPVKAVTYASSKWPHIGTGELVVMRASVGRHGDTSDLHRDDAELAEIATEELRLCIGVTGTPVDFRVSRWGGGLPQYTVGHVDRVRRIRAAVAGVRGLAVCGASYEGVGIPACIRTGQQAADQVRVTLTG
jgi:oxygen-dependent protoporphyrinogen oxidase